MIKLLTEGDSIGDRRRLNHSTVVMPPRRPSSPSLSWMIIIVVLLLLLVGCVIAPLRSHCVRRDCSYVRTHSNASFAVTHPEVCGGDSDHVEAGIVRWHAQELQSEMFDRSLE